jgi:CBS-domain-containing membrane protein
MQARDVMTRKIITVSESSPVHEIVNGLLRHHISAMPVVDDSGRPVGIVSEGDLLRSEGTSPKEPVLAGRTVAQDRAHGRTASAVMTRNVVTVNEDAPLSEIAALLERHHIKRVPVLRNGRLVGIVSRANLLHGLADTIVEHHEPGAMADRQLRDKLVDMLLQEPQLQDVLVNVTVSEGKVRLWGVVDTTDQAAAAECAARSLAGAKSVENNLGLSPVSGVPL